MNDQELQPVELEKIDSIIKKKHAHVTLQGQREYFELRKSWSEYLKIVLGVLIAFEMLLIVGVGAGYVNYMNYEWFINITVSQIFLEIIGMCYIIVNFLYPKNK